MIKGEAEAGGGGGKQSSRVKVTGQGTGNMVGPGHGQDTHPVSSLPVSPHRSRSEGKFRQTVQPEDGKI